MSRRRWCGWLLLAAALLLLTPASSASSAGSSPGGAPVFAPRQATAVRGVVGQSVTLHCQVLRIGDKAVSWVRSRDLQILTHGGVVFTGDARVSAPHVPHAPPRVHALRIDRLRSSDAGRYECQLNTEPKSSLFFNLTVLDEEEAAAETTIEPTHDDDDVYVVAEGGHDVLASLGGAAQLACAARRRSGCERPTPEIRWLWHGEPIVLQEGDSVSRSAVRCGAVSLLRLARVRAAMRGDYVCVAGGSSDTIRLHLVTDSPGEMEAMQRDQSAGGAAAARGTRVLLALTLARLALGHL